MERRIRGTKHRFEKGQNISYRIGWVEEGNKTLVIGWVGEGNKGNKTSIVVGNKTLVVGSVGEGNKGNKTSV